MTMRAAVVVALAIVVATACGSSSNDSSGSDAAPEADAAAVGCAPGEKLEGDGHCEPAGVPASSCGKGFSSDGRRGCVAILPADACASGQMAVPGETSCRDVAPCGTG